MFAGGTLFSQARVEFNTHKLSSNTGAWLNQAAEWAQEEWGYIGNFTDLAARSDFIQRNIDSFYIVTFLPRLLDEVQDEQLSADQNQQNILHSRPVGMFALFERKVVTGPSESDFKLVYELDYVYVRKEYRSLGVGRAIVEAAKEYAGGREIVLETLKPGLNSFYIKSGHAKAVCDGVYAGHPTTKLRI